MTWTYSGDPTSSPLDEVRFLCGDTDAKMPMLQDGEINYLLGKWADPLGAAYYASKQVMAKLAQLTDYWIGPEKVYASKRLTGYEKIHNDLRSRWIGKNALPTWTGNDHGGKGDLFEIGMNDYDVGGGTAFPDLDGDADGDG